MFFSSKKPLVALDIGGHSIKLAQIRKTGKGIELLNFGMISLPPDTLVDGEIEDTKAVAQAVKNLVKAEKLKNKNVVMGISGQSVIIKKISVPLMSEDELADMIREEAEQYIPFDIEEVNLDFQIVKAEGEIPTAKRSAPAEGEEEKNMDVLIVAARKDSIQLFLDVAKEAGLNVKVMDLDVFALENAYELNNEFEPDASIALANIGATMTNMNIIEAGVTAFSRDIPIGGNTISEEIQKNLSIGFSEAERLKLGMLFGDFTKADVIPHVKRGLEQIADEIKKTIEMFEKTADFKVSKLVISGGTSLMEGIATVLEDYLGIKTEIMDVMKSISFNEKQFDADYMEAVSAMGAITIGLALRMDSDK